jgi:transcriptional regulator with XRE-family HTH domain
MRQAFRRDRHSEIVEQRARKSATYRKTFERTLHQIDLALLVREMREDAGLTQAELAKKVGTTQSVIARLEDAEYAGHSLTMLERIAMACGVPLKLHRKEAKLRPRSRISLVQWRACRWATLASEERRKTRLQVVG